MILTAGKWDKLFTGVLKKSSGGGDGDDGWQLGAIQNKRTKVGVEKSEQKEEEEEDVFVSKHPKLQGFSFSQLWLEDFVVWENNSGSKRERERDTLFTGRRPRECHGAQLLPPLPHHIAQLVRVCAFTKQAILVVVGTL